MRDSLNTVFSLRFSVQRCFKYSITANSETLVLVGYLFAIGVSS
jgi:hypothetical protein